MKRQTAILFYAGVCLWGLLITASLVICFFPYQKVLGLAFQNAVASSRMIVSLQGVKYRWMGVQVAKLVVGHEAVPDKPLFELSKINVSWNPFSLLLGKLTISSEALAYDGVLQCTIDGIPILSTSNPRVTVKFQRINLAKYPAGTLPWCKSISGHLNGWIKKEVPMERPDRQKGSFYVNLTGGEIREPSVKGPLQGLILPYREIISEGRLDGTHVDMTRVFVSGDGIVMKGTGALETGELQQKISIKLLYEATSGSLPLPAPKGSITVSGNEWSPDIAVAGIPDQKEEGTRPKQ